MNKLNKIEAGTINIRPYTLFLMLFWSAIVSGSLVWNIYQARQGTLDIARAQAQDSFMKDVMYRRWNASHGGVYVPVSDDTPPNPYLKVPSRDITTPSGIKLTLMNPAYMTRQVHELAAKTFGIQGHITSLNPIRPANKPDPWETQALLTIQDGAEEVSSIEKLNGLDHMRLMKPLMTETGCLKCHAEQGYKVGDIRGGISVSIPMAHLRSVERSHILTLSLGHGLLLMVGLAGIGIGKRLLSKHIDSHKQAEDELQNRDNIIQGIFDSVPVGVCIMKNRVYERVNRNWCEKFGYKEEDLIGRKTAFLYESPEEYERIGKELYEHLNKNSIAFAQTRLKHSNGEFRNVDLTATPLNPHDLEAGTVVVLHDITERKQKEEALRESEERFRILSETSFEGVFLHDQGKIIDINNRGAEIFGYERDEIIGMSVLDLAAPEWRDVVKRNVMTGLEQPYEAMGLKKDGSAFPGELKGRKIEFKGNSIRITALRDLSEQKKTEEALLESEKKYRNFFENAQIGLYRTRFSDGLFLEANQRLVEMFGHDSRDEIIGRLSVADYYVDPEERSYVIAELKEIGEVRNFETQFKKRDGSIWWVRFSGTLVAEEYIEGVMADITETKKAEAENARLEEQYRQSQKVEAIGRLAGGVAHDMNNLLTPIIGYGEMLVADFGPDDRRRQALAQIVEAGYRSRDLVRQLLAFGRKQTLEYKPLDLNKTIEGFQKLLRRTIREDIALKIIPAAGLPTIKADIGQIEQVLMNLSVNAQDAMPKGGRLTLETAMAEIDENYAAVHPGMQAGHYVMMAISDTGCGMDEGTQEHIFEPFFSTKGQEGTGLGLATVYGIVKQHEGNIWVYSEPGKGTTFKVYLPISEESYVEKRIRKEPTEDLHGSETILLVEDNEQVRDLGHTVLTQQGYTVLVAKNGPEALSILSSQTDPVHLLLTDVVMPGMNGKELFAKATDNHPRLKVLYMSGYTDNVIAHHGVLDEGLQFIQKPFTIRGLSQRVREVLEQN